MIIDWHTFQYQTAVPWPTVYYQPLTWDEGLCLVEDWLKVCVGPRYKQWAYTDSGESYYIGVAFKWEYDKTLFVLTWSK